MIIAEHEGWGIPRYSLITVKDVHEDNTPDDICRAVNRCVQTDIIFYNHKAIILDIKPIDRSQGNEHLNRIDRHTLYFIVTWFEPGSS